MTTQPAVSLTGRAPTAPTDFYNMAIMNPIVKVETKTVTDHIAAVNVKATLTSGQNNLGVAGYFETHIAGTTEGHTYGLGSWINLDTGGTLSAGHIIVPIEGGVYTGEAEAAARIVFAGQHQAILGGAPASLHAWRLNTNRTITALIAAANPGSVGYAADVTLNTGSKLGNVPLFDIVGVGVAYVEVFSS